MPKISGNWILYLSTFTANLFFFSFGTMMSWNTPVLLKFRSDNNETNPLGAPLTVFQLSLCTSIYPFASIFAGLLVSKMPDIFGRKRSMIYIASAGLLCYIGLAFVKNVWLYCVIYMLVSFAITGGIVVAPTYVSEITETSNRGSLSSIVAVATTSGQLYLFFLSSFADFNTLSLCCGMPFLLMIILSFFTYESPILLSMRGDTDGALSILKKLRGNVDPSKLEAELKEKEKMIKKNDKKGALKILFKTSAGRKALFIALLIRSLPSISGFYAILSFFDDFLREPTHMSVSSNTLSIFVITFKMCTACLISSYVDRFGRRIYLLSGCIVYSASTFFMGMYFMCKNNNMYIPEAVKYAPIILLFLVSLGYMLGLAGVTYTLESEILPNEARAVGSGFVACISNLLLCLIAVSYPYIETYLGLHYCMFMFSVPIIIGFVLIFIYVPETKGKTFEEIKCLLEKHST
ncbi:unnamed protein product [Phyllotreta striolata]|uniref:Major facilitator superfamily (MFS) profile domain-containing protein n=1 Tax=Phyllotreta striolata TaxID=444603 RepID=A0A9N9XJW4_PHYSR|nr:unnamed protein product [Phyllotreta striolata]